MFTLGVAAVAAIGGGTGYAAKDAKPGSVLYPLRASMYQDVTGDVEVDADLLEMDDLYEETSANAAVSASVKASAAMRYQDNIERIEDKIADFEAEGNTSAAAGLERALEVHVRNYTRIFGDVDGDDNSSSSMSSDSSDDSSSSMSSDDDSSSSTEDSSSSDDDDDSSSAMSTSASVNLNGNLNLNN